MHGFYFSFVCCTFYRDYHIICDILLAFLYRHVKSIFQGLSIQFTNYITVVDFSKLLSCRFR